PGDRKGPLSLKLGRGSGDRLTARGGVVRAGGDVEAPARDLARVAAAEILDPQRPGAGAGRAVEGGEWLGGAEVATERRQRRDHRARRLVVEDGAGEVIAPRADALGEGQRRPTRRHQLDPHAGV